MTLTNILTLALVFSVLGCSSAASDKWRYQYRIAAAGTRSEHLVGNLTFDKRALPKALTRVVTPVGEFIYIDEAARGFAPQTNWVPCRTESDGSLTTGYYSKTGLDLLASKTLRDTTRAHGSNKKIAEAELKEGFYPASFHAKLDGTPSNWLYCVTFAYWVDPAKISQMLEEARNSPPADRPPP